MLALFESDIVGFNLYKVVVLIIFLYDLNERLPILLIYCSLRQT